MTMTSRLGGVLRAAGAGAVAGLAGGMVMTAGEKVEQAITHRPHSYVPGRALLTLLGQHPGDADKPVVWNHLMHYGTAAALGALRGVWAATGIRGAYANASHIMVRLGFDQTIENATGVGAPPATWPVRGADRRRPAQGRVLRGHRHRRRSHAATRARVRPRPHQLLMSPEAAGVFILLGHSGPDREHAAAEP